MCAREVEGVQCFRKTFLRLKGFADGVTECGYMFVIDIEIQFRLSLFPEAI